MPPHFECTTFSKSSNAPNTVVPAVALTNKGTRPSALTCNILSSKSSTDICPRSLVVTSTQLSIPKPSQCAAFFKL
uniref:Uncharacterized protein n=1 Tax=Glossina palpalis gambiensis TaxID=67801 RepID=A0A1B0BNF5_9MUSC